MTIESKIIDLLYWLKKRGLTIETYHRSEQYLCPITKRLYRGDQLKRHQRLTALWIPSARGAKSFGIPVTMEDHDGFKLVKAANFVGGGAGESEALLSLFNAMRTAAA